MAWQEKSLLVGTKWPPLGAGVLAATVLVETPDLPSRISAFMRAACSLTAAWGEGAVLPAELLGRGL